MNYKLILKVIEEYNRKTHFSLKNIRKQLLPLVERLADSDWEKELLLDNVVRFHRKFWNDKKENILVEGYTGNRYTEYDKGNDTGVPYPEEAKKEGLENGLLFDVHNHPPGSTFFPSGEDLVIKGKFGVKYSVIVNREGISIIKNTSDERFDFNKARRIVNRHLDDVMSIADQTPTVKALDERILEIDDDEYLTAYTKITHDLLMDDMGGIVGSVNDDFMEADLPVKLDYCLLRSDEQL